MKAPTPGEIAQLAAQDFASHAMLFSPTFELAPHIEILLSALEAVDRGEIRRLMVSMPPRHGKSHLVSELFPPWYLGRHPEKAVVSASYGQELADQFGRRVRGHMMDPRFAAIFSGCRISVESAAASRFDTIAGGSYFGIGRGGGLTGRGADLLLIDDLFKDMTEAGSLAIRETVKEWYSSVAYTRLMPGAAVVVVGTRWHQDDLVGWLLREHADENWTVISLPAIAEQDDSFRREGEALWPSHFPLEHLEKVRALQGASLFAADYQGRPVPAGGAVFKEAWLQGYTSRPEKLENVIQSWDTSFGKGATGDYSAGVTLGSAKSGFYVLDVVRGRWEFSELRRRVQSFAELWNPSTILIEDKASGQSLLQELRRDTRLPIRPVEAKAGKELRAELVSPLVEAGRLFLPETASWRAALVDELTGFPGGVNDDQVDALVHGLAHLRGHGSGEGGFFALNDFPSADERLSAMYGEGDYDPRKFYDRSPAQLQDQQDAEARARRRRWSGF